MSDFMSVYESNVYLSFSLNYSDKYSVHLLPNLFELIVHLDVAMILTQQ